MKPRPLNSPRTQKPGASATGPNVVAKVRHQYDGRRARPED